MGKKGKWLSRFLCVVSVLIGTTAFYACDGISSLFSDDPTVENTQSSSESASGVSIDSLDKWNYYAAKKTIEDEYGAVSPVSKSLKGNVEFAEDVEYGYDSAHSAAEENGDGSSEREDTTLPPNEGNKYYYDLYSWGTFTVHRTVYFQIELSDENGFLGSRLGTGRVEVAVALGELYDDLNMITFRNGDRFYSCMYHGYGGVDENGAEQYYFAAYRYIEGFYYVKNLDWEHYEYCVSVGAEGVGFSCDYRYTGTENEPISVVADSGYCVDKTVTYTVAELEAYFNKTPDEGIGPTV